MVAPENKLEDLAWYTLHGLLKMVHQTTAEEVAVAKAQLKTNYLASLATLQGANDVRAIGCAVRLMLSYTYILTTLASSIHPIIQNLGRQMLAYGRVMSPAEFFARVDAVSLADVKAVADQVINDQDHALAAVGCVTVALFSFRVLCQWLWRYD